MTQTPPPVKYDKNQIYTLEEFERLNCWLKTHELVVDGTAVTGFELDPTAKLITVPPVPVRKEVAVMEIGRQVCQWNILARQNGVVTSSQGGFSLPPDQEATLVTGAGLIIRAPDVAFTPKETYRNLTQEQLLTFRGEPFHPSFIVEVDDVGTPSKLADLTAKIKNEYFPAGIELGLLVDPVNRTIYTFKRTKLGNVRRVNRGWSDIPCDPCLPRFVLTVWLIDDAASQNSSESCSSDGGDLECPRCDEIFNDNKSFAQHFENEHARKRRKNQRLWPFKRSSATGRVDTWVIVKPRSTNPSAR